MSATTAGAVKAYLESKALGIPWFRDKAPADQPLPYGVIQEGVSITPDPAGGDLQDPNAAKPFREQAQVSIFQEWRKADGKSGEAYTLLPNTLRALHGARLATAPTTVYGVLVDGAVHLPPPKADANVVSDVITISIRRNL